VIVASNYHKGKLGWKNIITMPLPYPKAQGKYKGVKRGIVSVSRVGKQKVTKRLEKLVTYRLGEDVHRITYADTWESYYLQLSSFKVMLITSKEETFGYQVVDALMAGLVVIAPNDFSYPELLPKEYLYKTDYQMLLLVDQALSGKLKPLKKLNTDKESKSFFKNLIKLFKG